MHIFQNKLVESIQCLFNFWILPLFYIATIPKEDLITRSESLEDKKYTQAAFKRNLSSELHPDKRIGEKRSLSSPEEDNSSCKCSETECSSKIETNLSQSGEFDPINATKAKKTKVQQIKTK